MSNMLLGYRTVNINETRLEDLVRQKPDLIEEGLRFVAQQVFTDMGRLDVLLADSDDAFVVAELKVNEDDGMLMQAIDYYDYVANHRDSLAHTYRNREIKPDKAPRLFLIAPSFSPKLLNRIKWVDINISLFTYQCIEMNDSACEGTLLIYNEVIAPSPSVDTPPPQTMDHIDYIEDEAIRKLAVELIQKVQAWDSGNISVEPKKNFISIKVSGKGLMWLHTRKKHFWVETSDFDGEGGSFKIESKEDMERLFPLAKSGFTKLVGKTQALRS